MFSVRALSIIGFSVALSSCAQLAKPTASTAVADAKAAAAAAAQAAAAAAGPVRPATGPGSIAPPAAAPSNGASAAATATPTSPPAPPPSPLRAFAEVVKDAKRSDGLFPIWQKEDRLYIEIAEDQFNKPFLFAAQRDTGLGERQLYAHWMLLRHIVEFRRFGANNAQVQFVAKNTRFSAVNNPALQRAVDLSFSDSMIGATNVVSQPHPQRKSVLIDANSLLLNDLPQLGQEMERLFRVGYGFDPRNSYFGTVNTSKDQSVIEVKAHYYVPRIAGAVPGAPPGFGSAPPNNLVDPRSFFVTYQYSLGALPPVPMAARFADDRVGHFVQRRQDWGDEQNPYQRQYLVNRWRLEKKFPQAATSVPVTPITYWLDRNIPKRYIETIKAGVLEWNKAFEKIGFIDAMRVELEPDKDGPVLAGARHASIRWYLDTEPGALAIGPSLTDPRTGEILDADIAISDNWVRLFREVAVERLPMPRGMSGLENADAKHLQNDPDHRLCEHSVHAMMDLQFSASLLQARGVLEPNSPEAEKLVQAVLKDVVTHEIGHTLGLRHNFRASTTVPNSKLQDKTYTSTKGISGSVMDYNGVNTPLESEQVTDYVMTTLGPYDYWAIEYAYRPIEAVNEAAALAAIASRSTEPDLAYGTDEEYLIGYDPDVNQRDLGSDPLQYAKRRFLLAKELWARLQTRPLKPGESYGVLRRSSDTAFAQFEGAAEIASRYVGGVHFYRDHSGSSRKPYQPVDSARQRQALNLITESVFAPGSLQFDPNFVSRLVEDGLDRGFRPPLLPSVNFKISDLQRRLLNQLMSDSVAVRLLDSESSLVDKSQAMPLSEIYSSLQKAIWAELESGKEIVTQRRNLQRDHLSRLSSVILRPTASSPMDSRSLALFYAKQLETKLKSSNARSNKLSTETRAHLAESLGTLQDVLRSPVVRSGS